MVRSIRDVMRERLTQVCGEHKTGHAVQACFWSRFSLKFADESWLDGGGVDADGYGGLDGLPGP